MATDGGCQSIAMIHEVVSRLDVWLVPKQFGWHVVLAPFISISER